MIAPDCNTEQTIASTSSMVIKPYLWSWKLSHWVSGALFYALNARLWQAFAGIINLMILMRFTTPVEQGFYYTAQGLVNLYVFFELGLAVVILQSTPHYFSSLSWGKQGKIAGDKEKQAVFFKFLHQSFIVYLSIALCFALSLLPVGWYFLSTRNETVSFSWHLPWVLLIIATALNLCFAPFLAALEGSGAVASVYRFKLKQLLFANVLGWSMFFWQGALWMLALCAWVMVCTNLFWLSKNYFYFIFSAIKSSQLNRANFFWCKEIWPLQWRIALSWVSGYFLNQMFVPLLFYYRGPVAAGQMGMCLTIVNMLSLFALTWVSTVTPEMGRLIAKKQWTALDHLFDTAFWQSVFIFILLAVLFLTGIWALQSGSISDRLLPWPQILMLLTTTLFVHITSALSLYLRAHRRDPFVVFSVIGALLLAFGSWYAVVDYGSLGITLCLLVVNGLYGLPSTLWLWRHCKRQWHEDSVCQSH